MLNSAGHRPRFLTKTEIRNAGWMFEVVFDYGEQDPDNARNPIYTFLRAVSQIGYKRDGGGYLKRSLPPVEFEYTQPVVQDTMDI